MPEDEVLSFGFETANPHIIKVIGVGGGGGNAVNHMYETGIHDVSFVVCNTDNQVLSASPVQVKLQLGREGLGAGNDPNKGREEAENSLEAIDKMLNDGTKMVFITAGMGGGTGTGAAPVIAREAKKLGILTVGIVTIPFLFEGKPKIDQALDGVEAIAKNVDALLVVNNERLRKIYPDLTLVDGFARADDTLTIAARSIAEIITVPGKINLDFKDVCMVMRDGGVAIMSTGEGEGEKRVTKAIDDALNSPLLNNTDIYSAKKILIYMYCSEKREDTLMMEEINELHELMTKFRSEPILKWGYAFDPTLGKKVKVTILASGFGMSREDFVNKDDNSKQAKEDERITDRREKYYTDADDNKVVKRRRRIHHFTAADFDDENVISMVEQSPTANRTSDELNKIRNKSAQVETAAPEAPKEENQNLINFEIS